MGKCRLTLCGNPNARAEPSWPRPGLFVDRSYATCAGQRYWRPAISACALDSGPNGRRASLAGFKEVSYYPSALTPCGPE